MSLAEICAGMQLSQKTATRTQIILMFSLRTEDFFYFFQILSNEVGDEVNIQHLLNNKGSWRGRAQQILTLQKKIRDLESQIGSNMHKEQSSEPSVEEEMLGSSGIRRLSNQEKNVAHIRAMERERKEAFERMTGDYEKLKKDHEDLKSKFDGSKARIQVLSMELKTLKSQVVTLLQKGKHDDELVDALLVRNHIYLR